MEEKQSKGRRGATKGCVSQREIMAYYIYQYLLQLKELQSKRKEIRAEQEQKLAEQKREEEERIKREEAEKKAKEIEEKRRRLEEAEKKRQAMLQTQKYRGSGDFKKEIDGVGGKVY